jgi:hypothetical protein
LKTEESYPTQSMNHQQRRSHLKTHTKYFKEKKKMSLTEWFELIKTNRKNGEERHSEFLNKVIKRNVEFLVDREIDYRKQLNEAGLDGKAIEEKIEAWYENVIKDDSFMSEK